MFNRDRFKLRAALEHGVRRTVGAFETESDFFNARAAENKLAVEITIGRQLDGFYAEQPKNA